MGQAKKVKGQELKFRLALALGRTVQELEQTMTASEYEGWVEYLSTVPSTQELQMAQLLYIQTAKTGVKNVEVSDFLIAKEREEKQGIGIEEMTVEQVNELAGV